MMCYNGKTILMIKRNEKTVKFAFALFVFIIFCAHQYFYHETIIDEAFISFRYARNWAEGHGPVFNQGERVEGYTNFLTVAVLALGFKFVPHFDPLYFVKVIGVLSAIGQLILCVFLGFKIFKRAPWAGFLTAFFLACDGTFHFAAFNGLETQMFAFLVMAAVYFDLKEGTAVSWKSTFFYFLCFLTRPDGIVFFALSRFYKLAQGIKMSGKFPASFFITGIVFTLAAMIYVFSKYLFYGSIVPNTFFAKTGYTTSSRFLNGVFYILLFLRDHPVSFLLFLAFVPLFLKSDEAKFLLFMFSGFTVYLFYVGGDWLQGSRFFVPLLPTIYTLIVYGLVGFSETEGGARRLTRAFAFVCFLSVVCGQIYATNKTVAYAMVKTEGYKRAHIPLAVYLKNALPPDATVALMDVGIVAHYTNMRIVDVMGLTDAYIARHSGGENFLKRTFPVAYIFNKHPDVIVLANAKMRANLKGSFLVPIEEHIYAAPEFKKGFGHVKTYFHRKNYYLHVYLRRGSRVQGVEGSSE